MEFKSCYNRQVGEVSKKNPQTFSNHIGPLPGKWHSPKLNKLANIPLNMKQDMLSAQMKRQYIKRVPKTIAVCR